MFEKEAEEWWNNEYFPSLYDNVSEVWQEGAEFGYNKANEWHYVKDGDLPRDEKKYYIYSEEWGVEVKKFLIDVGYFECRKNEVIAWKEIVLPELKESE